MKAKKDFRFTRHEAVVESYAIGGNDIRNHVLLFVIKAQFTDNTLLDKSFGLLNSDYNQSNSSQTVSFNGTVTRGSSLEKLEFKAST